MEPRNKYISEHSALIIVDAQNDFMPGGALAVKEGDLIIPYINTIIEENFDLIIATQDWHPQDHCSFVPNGGEWPVHCVQNTPGASLHSGLNIWKIKHLVRKGTKQSEDGYSAFSSFSSIDLAALLNLNDIHHVYITGLATDYCVKETAKDSVKYGFDTTVLLDGCRGVDEKTTKIALEEMYNIGIAIRR